MSATLQQHTFEIPSVDHKKCSRKRFYFEDELSHNVNKRVKAPFHSDFHSDTNFSPSTLPFSCDRDKKLFTSFKSNNIALKKNKTVPNIDSHSEMSRIIDLSTGESLDSVSNTDHDRQKLKRTLELVEHDYKDSPSVEGDNFLGIMGEPTFGNNFHKKIRTSKKPTVNYIEDVEDVKDDSRLINNTVGTIQEFKNYVTTSPSISNISSTSNVTINPTTKSLPLVVRPKKIEFTPQYQEVFNKYMRSQLDTVNDDYSVHGKEMVLYRQNNKNNNEYIIKDDDYTNSEGKIVEIEDDDDIQMLDTDETNTSGIGVGLLFNDGGQSLDEDDKMDIDE
ncbi:15717_t:CDS:1 [Dentiscutata heterogama]|uniref:15717_t:CDS:1 n=1 Tax=Dentiscutata heterogama TaxID=1316150 RepID=A0ACA9KQA2_9GLOM|nr:15717_t:CDS:1 [Dentiscutata heterogama]